MTLQIEHDALPLCKKMVQHACVQISNMKEKYKTWDIGDKHV